MNYPLGVTDKDFNDAEIDIQECVSALIKLREKLDELIDAVESNSTDAERLASKYNLEQYLRYKNE